MTAYRPGAGNIAARTLPERGNAARSHSIGPHAIEESKPTVRYGALDIDSPVSGRNHRPVGMDLHLGAGQAEHPRRGAPPHANGILLFVAETRAAAWVSTGTITSLATAD